VYIALCRIVVHNTAQNRTDNFPSYPPDNHHSSDDVYLGASARGPLSPSPTTAPPLRRPTPLGPYFRQTPLSWSVSPQS